MCIGRPLYCIYTASKGLWFISHSVFSEVARQLTINTNKNPNRKIHLWSFFFKAQAEVVFLDHMTLLACVTATRGIFFITSFWKSII